MASSLVRQLAQALQQTGANLSVAESCTGGLLSSEITKLAGVSSVYWGGVVSYDNRIKEGVLGVPRPLLRTNGAVSQPVALAMARGVRRLMKTTWACAITGIAGPEGGTPDKPVGTVWIAVVGPQFEAAEKSLFKGGREEIQKTSAEHALTMLVKAVQVV